MLNRGVIWIRDDISFTPKLDISYYKKLFNDYKNEILEVNKDIEYEKIAFYYDGYIKYVELDHNALTLNLTDDDKPFFQESICNSIELNNLKGIYAILIRTDSESRELRMRGYSFIDKKIYDYLYTDNGKALENTGKLEPEVYASTDELLSLEFLSPFVHQDSIYLRKLFIDNYQDIVSSIDNFNAEGEEFKPSKHSIEAMELGECACYSYDMDSIYDAYMDKKSQSYKECFSSYYSLKKIGLNNPYLITSAKTGAIYLGIIKGIDSSNKKDSLANVYFNESAFYPISKKHIRLILDNKDEEMLLYRLPERNPIGVNILEYILDKKKFDYFDSLLSYIVLFHF